MMSLSTKSLNTSIDNAMMMSKHLLEDKVDYYLDLPKELETETQLLNKICLSFINKIQKNPLLLNLCSTPINLTKELKKTPD
jgi:hypothetical protein